MDGQAVESILSAAFALLAGSAAGIPGIKGAAVPLRVWAEPRKESKFFSKILFLS